MQESVFCKKSVIVLPITTCRRKPILRKLLFCFVLLLLQTCLKTYGQKISLTFDNAPLERVLQEMGKKAGNILWYSNSNKAITQGKPITIYFDSVPVEDALKLVLRDQPLYFEKSEGCFVIKANESNLPVVYPEDEVSENPKHQSTLYTIFIAIVVTLAANFSSKFIKSFFTKKNKEAQPRNYRVYTNEENERLKRRPEVFNAFLRWVKAKNLPEDVRVKIIDLMVYHVFVESLDKPKSMAKEAGAAVEAIIKAHHAFETTETFTEGL